jgi:hypothetical protein
MNRCPAYPCEFCHQVHTSSTALCYGSNLTFLSISDQLSEDKCVPISPFSGVLSLTKSLADDIFKSTFHHTINRSSLHHYSIPLLFGMDYHIKLEVSIVPFMHNMTLMTVENGRLSPLVSPKTALRDTRSFMLGITSRHDWRSYMRVGSNASAQRGAFC